ncbi:unnamed protein product [Prunus armeniaca]
MEPRILAVWSLSTYMITNTTYWILVPKNVFSSVMHLIRNGTGVIILLVESDRSLPGNSNLLQNDQSPEDRDRSSPCYQTQKEKIEEFLTAPENSSAPIPDKLSPHEDVIQVTSFLEIDNINEISHDDLISEGTKPTHQIPKRKNHGKPPVHYEADLNAKGKYPINNYVSTNRLSESRMHFVKQLAEIPVPNSVTEALEDSKWKEAMNEEMRALQKNGTWELVPLPHGKKTVGYRWIYAVKLKAYGSIERYKARLVVKGYTQRYGIDYQQTFAPVAKIKTIRVLLSLAVNLDWPLHQFDVKNASLHGDLEEEVHMDLPPGCNLARDKENQVCKPKKSLYGLTQSPRAWVDKFTESMKNFGYIQSNVDHTLFLKSDGKRLTEFEMKDLGDLKYFLGIEVARSTTGIFLSQRKYVLYLLIETRMLGCKPADTPIEMNHNLYKDMYQEPTNKKQYQRLVERLICLAHTRPDVDWASSVIDRRSTSSYFTFVGGNLVTWRSKKQNVVSRSSAEVEYRGMAHGVCELLWIKRLLVELGFKPGKPMKLHCDNKSTIDIAHNPVQHDRTKHVEVDRHFIKEKIEKKIIRLPFIRSEDQLTDILTKAVCGRVFHDSLTKLGIGDVYAPT